MASGTVTASSAAHHMNELATDAGAASGVVRVAVGLPNGVRRPAASALTWEGLCAGAAVPSGRSSRPAAPDTPRAPAARTARWARSLVSRSR